MKTTPHRASGSLKRAMTQAGDSVFVTRIDDRLAVIMPAGDTPEEQAEQVSQVVTALDDTRALQVRIGRVLDYCREMQPSERLAHVARLLTESGDAADGN